MGGSSNDWLHGADSMSTVPSVYHSPAAVLPISAPLFYRIVYSRPTGQVKNSYIRRNWKVSSDSPLFFYIRESVCLGFAIIARDGIMIDETARWWVTSSGMNYWSMVSYNNKNSSLVRRYKNECIYTSWIFNENTFFSEMKIFLENSFIINKRFLYQVFE